MLKSFVDFHCSATEDVIDDKYLLHLGSPIEELDNEFVNYYLVTDIDKHEEYYGIVFKNNFVPDFELIYYLKTLHQPYISSVVSCGVTLLSSNQHAMFVVIVDKYDIQSTLASALPLGDKATKDLLQEQVIPTIAQAITFCTRHNTSLGNICPESIILREDGTAFVREPFICPNNFYQLADYLTIELARCAPYARGSVAADDIYALGILCASLLSKKLPSEHHGNYEEFIAYYQEHGSYKAAISGMRFTDNWRMLLQGLLSDNIDERWKPGYILDWCAGYINNIPKKPKSSAASAYITFNNRNYTSISGLCSAMYSNWDKALSFIGEEKFYRWLGKLNVNDQMRSYIESLCSTLSNTAGKSAYYIRATADERNSTLNRVLMVLGSGHVVHTKNASYSLLNLSQYISLNMSHESRAAMQELMNNISQDAEKLRELFKSRNNDDMVALLDTVVKHYTDDKYAVSGMERLLYMLRPEIACQSPVIAGSYVNSIPAMLVELDAICHSNVDQFNIDRHITAFVASKVGVKSNADFIALKRFPQIAEDPIMLGLPVLCMAQREAPDIEIEHLIHAISSRLIELVDDNVHNQKLQKNMIRQLLDEGDRGALDSMLSIVSDSNLFERDLEGYRKALESIRQLNAEISKISQMNMIYSQGMFIGQKLTVLLSYVLCLAVIVILMV